MSFVSRLIDPNPPLTSDQVQAAAAAALAASPPSPIRSIQRGRITLGSTEIEKTVTITQVQTGKSVVNLLTTLSMESATANVQYLGIFLNSSTEVTLHRNQHFSRSVQVRYEVIEYY